MCIAEAALEGDNLKQVQISDCRKLMSDDTKYNRQKATVKIIMPDVSDSDSMYGR